MPIFRHVSLCVAACAFVSCLQAASVDYDRDIKPILSDRCYACHGPDGGEFGEKWKAGLRLDLKSTALANLSAEKVRIKNLKRATEGKSLLKDAGDPRYAIVPGKPEESLLIDRITTSDHDDIMPPIKSKLQLSAEEKELLTRWIREGAEWKEHWAFRRIERPAKPKVKLKKWSTHPLDDFVLRQLEEKGVRPALAADKLTWLRRVSLDLSGLPPSLAEQDAFLADRSKRAHEAVVDRLLASDAYSEHMAGLWLDNARYADTHGYQYDTHRTNWPWRDWVIQAFKQNMPYDVFVTEQLAGDMLPDSTRDQKVATAFNRHHPFTIEGGVIKEEYRVQYVNDRVTTFGTVFLGLTFECSRCHNHKYDPITQKDFYEMSAFFSNIKDLGVGGGVHPKVPPLVSIPLGDEARVKEIEVRVAELETQLAAPLETPAYLAWKEKSKPDPQGLGGVTAKSQKGLKAALQNDGSFLFSGKVSKTDVHTFEGTLPAGGYRSLVIEALPHKDLPKKGPGLSASGNAVLTYVTLELAGKDGVFSAVALTDARANKDQSKSGLGVTKALKEDSAGWGLGAASGHARRVGVFNGADTFEVSENTRVRVRLHYGSSYSDHVIGRVRVSFSDAGLEDCFAAVKDSSTALRSDEELRKAYRLAEGVGDAGDYHPLLKELDELKKRGSVDVMVMEEQEPGFRKNYVLGRGAYDNHGEEVFASTPEFLPKLGERPKNRLGLAQWLTDRENPLFARVTVNRYWQLCFGDGLVKSAEDFGRQGDAPSHPELLDLLSVEFMEGGWDVRALLKTITLSSTYRQSSVVRAELGDPENRLLARGPRFRLPAESIRDQALAVSGLLSSTVGGPSVFPYQPTKLWMELTNRKRFQMTYTQSEGGDLYRRSLYTYWKRALHPPAMSAFDAPNRETCRVKRSRTNTPIQALVMLHDPTFVEAARMLADRVMRAQKAPIDRARLAFRLALGREPSQGEGEVLLTLYDAHLASLKGDEAKAVTQLAVGAAEHQDGLDKGELAAMAVVCQAIFNTSEFVTHR